MGRLTGERRAVAAAFLAMYGFLYLLVSLQAPEGWTAAFGSLAGIYGLGFLGVVAGYFWARWFVIGLGLSGLITGVMSIFQLGALEPALVFYAGTHAAIAGLLWGDGMSKAYDGRHEWRKRFHLDESGTHRLGKSVIRIGVSLPYVVLFALAPREGAALACVGAGTVLLGLWGLTHLRTWALSAFAAGGALMLTALVSSPTFICLGQGTALHLGYVGLGAVCFTFAAILPFVGPVTRYLQGKES